MKNPRFILSSLCFFGIGLLLSSSSPAWDKSSPLIIDHSCTDISTIPPSRIDSVQATLNIHYAHTSHGEQLVTGLQRIENSDSAFDVSRGLMYLPSWLTSLCYFDGQSSETYITPELYWEGSAGLNQTRTVLDANPEINVSIWCWCAQLEYYTASQTQGYLDAISTLEAEYPDVAFVYMTCNAQGVSYAGYYRHLRNEMVRDYCLANNKALFDFADLDAWWYNSSSQQWEQSTYVYNSTTIPKEHPQFSGDDAGHTTYESCDQKGQAFWYLMSSLNGWGSQHSLADSPDARTDDAVLQQNFPNPFNPVTTIEFELPAPTVVKLSIHDLAGRHVATLLDGLEAAGAHSLVWNGRDGSGRTVGSGVYYYRLDSAELTLTRKMVLTK
ncbi:MAG: FlgD immunoglobulin-like domain containing protein [bacterium]